MVSGIYKITNTVANKVYVGSSKRVGTRIKAHFSALRANRHKNSKLQKSFNQDGEAAFSWELLQVVEGSTLREVEQEFIDEYKAWSKGYNLRSIASRNAVGCDNPDLTTKKLTVRCSDEEYAILVAFCKAKEKSQNTVIRELIARMKRY